MAGIRWSGRLIKAAGVENDRLPRRIPIPLRETLCVDGRTAGAVDSLEVWETEGTPLGQRGGVSPGFKMDGCRAGSELYRWDSALKAFALGGRTEKDLWRRWWVIR